MSIFDRLFSSSTSPQREPVVLLEEGSPSCPIKAVVEQDDRVAYIYLVPEEDVPVQMRSCWIRNLQAAPKRLETKLIKQGVPPMLPRSYCRYPQGQQALEAKRLHIIWLEEGDGAALMEGDEILAIVPGWSGHGGLGGYARDCVGEGDFVWELSQTQEILQRVHAASDFWQLWEKEINPFTIEQPRLLSAYEELFGEHDKYFAIDGGDWPPRGLYLRQGEAKVVFATVGVSLLPMPLVEMYTEDRLLSNRIELGMMMNSPLSEASVHHLARWMSAQASIPWDQVTFLGEGHTTNLGLPGPGPFSSVLLTANLHALPKVELEPYRNSRLNFLWMVPIAQSERQLAMDEGSEVLVEKLNEIGSDIFSFDRESVV